VRKTKRKPKFGHPSTVLLPYSVVERGELDGSTAEGWQWHRQDTSWQDDGSRCQGTKLLLTTTVWLFLLSASTAWT